jgi:hypothetical protein
MVVVLLPYITVFSGERSRAFTATLTVGIRDDLISRACDIGARIHSTGNVKFKPSSRDAVAGVGVEVKIQVLYKDDETGNGSGVSLDIHHFIAIQYFHISSIGRDVMREDITSDNL